jgi:hypothetical protein
MPAAAICLQAAEELLVLELLFGQAQQRLQRDLVAERVVVADLERLLADVALTSANMLA